VICDANLILRYILEDIPDSSVKAAEIMERENVFVPFEVLAEVVYVLLKVLSR
jgi:predicted nucleic acid-binding protein